MQPFNLRKSGHCGCFAEILVEREDRKRWHRALGEDHQGRVAAVNGFGFTESERVEPTDEILNVHAGLLPECGKLPGGGRPGNFHYWRGERVKSFYDNDFRHAKNDFACRRLLLCAGRIAQAASHLASFASDSSCSNGLSCWYDNDWEVVKERNIMLYRTMPKSGDRLSILGFGCMRLPVQNGRIDEIRAIGQVRGAIDQGVNYLDTAWPYHAGESELVVGRALRGGYRERVKLATKLPSWMIKSRPDMDRFLNAQLKKLDTDHVDYYLLHSLDGRTWDNLNRLDVLEFLARAKADGRIANAGFSFHGLAADFVRIVDAHDWCFCQIQYNYLDQDYQAGTKGLEYAHRKGLGVVVMEPLRGGNLGLATPPPAVAAIWQEAPVRRTPVEWALRWVWNRPEVTVVLSGMNEDAHIRENVAIASEARAGSLTRAELDLVERASRAYRSLMKVGCTGCGYCLPCASGVMIPLCFEEHNKMHMFGALEEAKFRYAFRMSGELGDGHPGYASQCVQCGECLDKCPQHIPIPDVLAQVAGEFEGPDLMDRVAAARKIFQIRPA